jgi:hypothetical protein
MPPLGHADAIRETTRPIRRRKPSPDGPEGAQELLQPLLSGRMMTFRPSSDPEIPAVPVVPAVP